LIYAPLGGRVQIIKRGADEVSEDAKVRSRTPPGHPEGYLEAFANLYAGFAEAIRARKENRPPGLVGQNIPLAYDGLKGVAFVEAVVDSAEATDPTWIRPIAV
jgi:predicted dehydrogenase